MAGARDATNQFTPVRVPRYDYANTDSVKKAFLAEVSCACATNPAAIFVLHTAFWPPGPLEQSWLRWLNECVGSAGAIIGDSDRVVLAELTPHVFDQIKDRTSPVLELARGGLLNQLGQDSHLSPRMKSPLLRRLNHDALDWISHEVQGLEGVVKQGHWILPNGRHSNVNVRFGELDRVAGGDGWRNYVTSVLVRQIKPEVQAPLTLVYWSNPTRWSLPGTVEHAIVGHFARLGVEAKTLRLGGEYANPNLDPTLVDARVRSSTLVLLTDIIARGTSLPKQIELLRKHGLDPRIVAAFLRFCYTPSLSNLVGPGPLILPMAVIDAEDYPCREECPIPGIARRTEPDGRSSRSSTDGRVDELWRPNFAAGASVVLCGGKISARPATGDRRHLHDYLEPGPRLDLLLSEVAATISGMDVRGIVQNDTEICQKITEHLKVAMFHRHLEVIHAKNVRGKWKLQKEKLDPGPYVVVDERLNTSRSLRHLLARLKRPGVRIDAVVVWENKLDAVTWRELIYLARKGYWNVDGSQTAIFQLYRSLPVDDGLLDQKCQTCEFQKLVGLLTTNPGNPIPAARQAYQALSASEIWPPARKGQSDKQVLELDSSNDIVVQLNRLLRHHDELRQNLLALDLFIKQSLLRIRTRATSERRSSQLRRLDELLVERMLLFLDPVEVTELSDDFRGESAPLGRQLSLALNALGRADSEQQFVERLQAVTEVCEREPALATKRYQDLLRGLLLPIVVQPDLLEWLGAACTHLGNAQSKPLTQLRKDLNFLRDRAAPTASMVGHAHRGFLSGRGTTACQLQEVSEDLIEDHLNQGGVILDLIASPPQLRDQSFAMDLRFPGRGSPEDRALAAVAAYTIMKRKIFSYEATPAIEQFRGESAPNSPNDHFRTIRARLTSPRQFGRFNLFAPDASRRPDTPRHPMAQQIVSTGERSVLVIWLDDRSSLADRLNEWATKP